MPHITARFIDGTPNLEAMIQEQKSKIRMVVAEMLGYPAEEVAFYSSREDPKLTDNALPLEIVIDSGTRSLGREDECNKQIKQALVASSPLRFWHFGICLCSHGKNSFVEHKPG